MLNSDSMEAFPEDALLVRDNEMLPQKVPQTRIVAAMPVGESSTDSVFHGSSTPERRHKLKPSISVKALSFGPLACIRLHTSLHSRHRLPSPFQQTMASTMETTYSHRIEDIRRSQYDAW